MNKKEYPVVILCGGMGTRLREQTEYIPKPLVPIGGKPILWHIMKIHAHHGLSSFICCLGYKGDLIKQYFLNYEYLNNDFCIHLHGNKKQVLSDSNEENWSVTVADTGQDTMTGGRIKRIEKYIDTDTFLMTYGDGVADIDIGKLIEFHEKKGKIATVTGVHTPSRFGIIERDKRNIAEKFREKPRGADIINGGFFVLNRKVFDYLDENCIFEQEPLERLVEDRQLAVYEHGGFWFCMDTYRDYLELNKLWDENQADWKIW